MNDDNGKQYRCIDCGYIWTILPKSCAMCQSHKLEVFAELDNIKPDKFDRHFVNELSQRDLPLRRGER